MLKNLDDVRQKPRPAGLAIEDVTKSYPTPNGPLDILLGVDLHLEPGETLALTGESGSGKSTLLHLIAGLDVVDSGRIMIGDTMVTGASDQQRAALRCLEIGFVFQQFNLIPSLTIHDNIAFQARLSDRVDRPWIDELAERLGLTALLQHYPEQLSGGQQQRVAIARALAAKPALLLADEPTGNLDEKTGDGVVELALDLVADTGSLFLMVTHSTRLAAKLQRQARLEDGRLL